MKKPLKGGILFLSPSCQKNDFTVKEEKISYVPCLKERIKNFFLNIQSTTFLPKSCFMLKRDHIFIT